MKELSIEEQKRLSAERAVNFIKSGMIVGLGTGSTVKFVLRKISDKIKNGELKNVVGVPTSSRTEKEANRLGIPIISLNEAFKKAEKRNLNHKHTYKKQLNKSKHKKPLCIDLTIDGADEVDKDMNLIKGGGGALLREKIVAMASKKLIIVVDNSKFSKYLGEKSFVPIEVIPFAQNFVNNFLKAINAKTKLRKNKHGDIYLTDQKNIIIDANFGVIKNPKRLAQLLDITPGVVEHGLFIDMADKVIGPKQDKF
ncbi:ribose 5-phosphate isomerase A [Melioribacteraceae bacterium 4301-Me]|uniref:ribose 5-phosphate isomerase A n=1 Tax=Pyranulibacter aquaticus TaxID=3163344 RepID=UPI00359BDFB9